MTTRVFAVATATAVTILLLYAVVQVLEEIRDIENELDVEMDAFRAQANDLWSEMIAMGAGRRERRESEPVAPSPKESETEVPEDKIDQMPNQFLGSIGSPYLGIEQNLFSGIHPPSGYGEPAGIVGGPVSHPQPHGPPVPAPCHCNPENKCPPGPPGPKGLPGSDGPDGEDGQDGIDGIHSEDAQAQVQQFDKCFHCPAGPIGPPGPPGRPGPRGMRGARGNSGIPGRDGQPGYPGQMGANGPPGPHGEEGAQGEHGENAEHAVGRKGQKGEPGEQGPPGDEGEQREMGARGLPGPIGERGPEGAKGEDGDLGPPGPQGEEGEPGMDAEYCPCPRKQPPTLNDFSKLAAMPNLQFFAAQPKLFRKRML